MINNACAFILSITLISCSDQKHEVIGVTDFKTVNTPVCVWLNGEPVFHLLERATFPRLANSYPIKRGANTLEVKKLLDDGLPLAGVAGPVFFYSNGESENHLDLVKVNEGVSFAAQFNALNDYEIDGNVRRSTATRETEDLSKIWVVEYLESLRFKKRDVLVRLFEEDPKSEKWFEDVEVFFGSEAQCVLPVSDKNLITKKGQSLVLLCGVNKLAEWKMEKGMRHFDSFLFCACEDGLYLRVSAGKWVKVKQPRQ